MRLSLFLLCLLIVLGSGSAAWAQQGPLLQNPGFQIHRAQLTPAGESSFMVDAPRFSAGTLSVGLSLDYGHRPLVLGVEGRDGQFRMTRVLIEHQMLGSLDVAGSFCDCMRLSASLPFTLLERGPSSADPSAPSESLSLLASSIRSAAADPRTGIVLENGLSASDPRFGMMVRLYGKPGESLFSASLGADVWVPLRKFLSRSSSHTSDMDARVLSKLVLTGDVHPLSWSVTGAFLFRPEAHLGDLPSPQGSTAGSELQAGAGLYYTTPGRGFSVGPEARFSTLVTPRDYAFKPFYSSLEVLLGLHLRAGERLRIGVAGGAGMDRQPGTPDFRLLVRMSYDALSTGPQARPSAPLPPPPEPPRVGMQLSLARPEVEVPRPESPEEVLARMDRDGDGILDARDVCPETPLGDTPDPRRLGCPAEDRDRDTVLDAEDACPEEPGMPGLEPRVNGCPLEGVEVRQDRLLPRQPLAFAVNTDVLLAESLPVLAQLAEAIRARPWLQKLRIEGHTDNSGSKDFNQSLSLRRAESVRRWLVGQGLDAARLEVAGFGPSHPIADNASEAGRASNRRVDFVITSTSPERPADQSP